MKLMIKNWRGIKNALNAAKQEPEPMTRARGAKLIEGLHDRGTDRLLNDVLGGDGVRGGLNKTFAHSVLSCGKTTPRV